MDEYIKYRAADLSHSTVIRDRYPNVGSIMDPIIKSVVAAQEEAIGKMLEIVGIDPDDVTPQNVHLWREEMERRGYRITIRGLDIVLLLDDRPIHTIEVKVTRRVEVGGKEIDIGRNNDEEENQ